MKKYLKFSTLALALVAIIFWGCPGDLNDLNSVSSIDNIVGTWHATRDEGGISTDYQVEITKSESSDSTINISNFYNNGSSAYAYVKDLEITLPNQKVGNITVEGTATISSDYQRIVWNVVADSDRVTITMSPGQVAKHLLAR